MVVGIYIIFYCITKSIGIDRIRKILSPVVVEPIIMLIGLRLLAVALSQIGLLNNEIPLNNFIVAFLVVVLILVLNK